MRDHDHIQMEVGGMRWRLQAYKSRIQREELHQGYAKQRAMKIASRGLSYSEFSFSLVG